MKTKKSQRSETTSSWLHHLMIIFQRGRIIFQGKKIRRLMLPVSREGYIVAAIWT
jgi:hypothetical protein